MTPDRGILQFADFELDPACACLRRGGRELHLRRKSFEVLVELVTRRGRVASKADLIGAVWQGTAVSDDVLIQCIKEIRRVLDDDPQSPRFVRTVPRAGYRFIAPVHVETEALTDIDVEVTPTAPVTDVSGSISLRSRWGIAGFALAAIALAVAAWTWLGGAFAGAPASADAMTGDPTAYRDYALASDRAAHFRSGDAILLLERAIARDPEFAMAHARIGYVHAVANHDVERARPYFARALALAKRLSARERQLVTAWDAIARQDYDVAIATYRAYLSAYPLDFDAYVQLSRLLVGEEQLTEALAVAERGLAVDGRHANLHNALALAHAALGHRDRALAAAERYVEAAPAEPNALDTLGLMLIAQGRYQDAADAFSRAIALAPDFEVAYVHLGNVYVRMGRYRDADGAYADYLARAPSDTGRGRARLMQGLVALRRGDHDRARDLAASFVEASGPTGDTLWIDFVAGKPAAVRTALAHVPATPASRGGRAESRFGLFARGVGALAANRPDDAVRDFTELQRYRPMHWHIDDYEHVLADTLLRVNRVEAAIAEYRRLLAADPAYPLARYWLGRALERAGDADQAHREYRAFLETWRHADPDVPEVVDARRRLHP